MDILSTHNENSWEGFFEAWQKDCLQNLWRTHSDSVNKALLLRWWPVDGVKHLLKTDLFDEAVNDGLHPLLAARASHITGMDISFPVAFKAQSRYPGFQTIGADVRCLPFMDNTFDLVVSLSTLDHFRSVEEIIMSLYELHRVLRPDKQMVITFDNLANPIVRLRNWLPFRLLQRLNIVPYYMGVTMGPYQLQYLMERTGFDVLEVETMMHCPRVLAVPVAHWMQKYTRPKAQGYFLCFLQAFECLSCLPTRFFTGHFVAIWVMKR
jgi:SAM-dependent methyltransferase